MTVIKEFLQSVKLYDDNNYEQTLSTIKTLLECGCCCRCCLRFLGCNNLKLYSFEEQELIEKTISLVIAEGICTACLGSLQYADEYIKESFEQLKADPYQVNTISLSCTLPVSTLIRNHLIRIHLEDKGHKYSGLDEEGFIKDPKNIFKFLLGEYIEKQTDLKIDNDAGLRMTVVIDHESSSQEHMMLAQLEKPLLKIKTIRQKRRRVTVGDSRQCIHYALKKLDTEEARKLTSIPPAVPTEKAKISSVPLMNAPTYIGGRYLKFSREYSQTPWSVRGAKLAENSVSDCFELVKKYHRADDAKFGSAGREDANVRMLGTGRPFFLELVNPRIPRLSDEEYKKLEDEINQSPLHKDAVQVRHLTYVEPKHLRIIKEGEEKKTKKYRALVWLSEPLTDELVKHINEASSKECPIQQKTPIRVFQRRAAIIRPKTIYSANIARLSDKPEEAHFGAEQNQI
ncbi:hypothetical protein G6F37_010239 [Rhizopus arrhizus]|nr:hypothetical protein G6F38_010327 [Rhizopus arrhizus]KAG1153568.1 hypothetical protein G6F37_010239 [Rhizopus arrhizus]